MEVTLGGAAATIGGVRTGGPSRDLPAKIGNWSAAFRRFSDWRRADVFVKIFAACSDEPDMEYAMVDAPIVGGHRHRQDAAASSRTSSALPCAPTRQTQLPRHDLSRRHRHPFARNPHRP